MRTDKNNTPKKRFELYKKETLETNFTKVIDLAKSVAETVENRYRTRVLNKEDLSQAYLYKLIWKIRNKAPIDYVPGHMIIEAYRDMQDELRKHERRNWQYSTIDKHLTDKECIQISHECHDEKLVIEMVNSVLDERQRQVLNSTFGLNNCEVRKTNEIAKEMNVSRQTIHTIKRQALEKLKINLM